MLRRGPDAALPPQRACSSFGLLKVNLAFARRAMIYPRSEEGCTSAAPGAARTVPYRTGEAGSGGTG